MAFDTARLQLMGGGGGVAGTSHYQYITDGTDTVGTCTTIGFFNNLDDFIKLRVGDVIEIIVPGTQALEDNGSLKSIVDVGKTIVARVIDSTGEVECTADYEATTITYT